MDNFYITFCIILSTTLVASIPQDLLGEVDDYQYGIDLSKLEDDIMDQSGASDEKKFLQYLLSKWKTSTTTTDYSLDKSSTETTTVSTTPKTTTRTTAETKTVPVATTNKSKTTTSSADPAGFIKDLPNKKHNPYENLNSHPIYQAPGYQPLLTYSYYPIAHYNIPQMPQAVEGMQGMAYFSAIPQIVPGLPVVSSVAAIPQLPQVMLGTPDYPHVQAYNPYSQHPTQIVNPNYNSYRIFNE